MIHMKVIKKIKTHNLRSVTPPPPAPPNHAVYKTVWKNIVEWSRPQMAVWLMHVAFWIIEVTDAHSEYVVIVSPLQQWLHEPASLLLYTYIACLIITLLQRELLLAVHASVKKELINFQDNFVVLYRIGQGNV
jgi:hypothetical protein